MRRAAPEARETESEASCPKLSASGGLVWRDRHVVDPRHGPDPGGGDAEDTTGAVPVSPVPDPESAAARSLRRPRREGEVRGAEGAS